MAWACSNCGGRGLHIVLWRKSLRGEDQLEDLEIDGRMVLIRIFEKWDGKAWIALI
jgi:hypothetical protein